MIRKPYIALFFSIVSVSFAAILIVSTDAPSLAIAFFRLLFTAFLLIPFLLLNKKIRKELFNIPKSSFLIMVGIGFILAAHFALWITSLEFTSVASSVILVTAHPIIVGPLSYYLFKEKLSILNFAGISLSLLGVSILVVGNYGLTSLGFNSVKGNILAMLGGVAAGLYILGGRKIRRTVSVVPYAFVVYLIGSIVLLFLCISFQTPLYSLNIRDYQLIFLMALIPGIFGHTLYNWSLEHIRAAVASVALLGEPVGSAFLAFILPWINQIPTKFTLLGGGITLLGIYLTSRKYKKKEKIKEPV